MTTLPGDLVGSARERYQRADQVGDPRHRRHRGERVPAGAARDGRGRRADRGEPDIERGRAWAEEQGVTRAVEGYDAVIADPEVEAVYIPLPNGLHAEWTIAALEAGKVVFCEKPLCGTVEETERVLAAARATGVPLWEAFVFPFHEQMARVRAMIDDGTIGTVREIQSRFHFVLDDPDNIRLFANLAGGSIQDVGCYPIRLARLLFDAEPDLSRAIADAEWTADGADTEMWGALVFPGDRRLVFSCGFRSGYDTFTRVLGTEAEIRMTGPFHPDSDDEADDRPRRRVRHAARADVGRDVVHPGDPAHPPRDPRAGGAAPPRRGRSDGERASDRRAARCRPLTGLTDLARREGVEPPTF